MSPKRPREICERGFTLTELMIVAAILGIGATLALPNYLNWNARSQLKQATSEVASQLILARMAAMNRNKTVTVSFSLSGGQVHLSSADSSGMAVTPDMATMRLVTQVVGGPVTFNSLGMRTSGGAAVQQITLSTPNNLTYSVMVSASGRVFPCYKNNCP